MAALVILVDTTKTDIDTKTANGARDLVRDLFIEAGIQDGWRMQAFQQTKGGPHLSVKLSPRAGYPLVLACQPGGNDTAWEWKLTPTIARKNFDNVQNAIRQALERRKEASSLTPDDPPELPPGNAVPETPVDPTLGGQFADKYAKAQQLVAVRNDLRGELAALAQQHKTLSAQLALIADQQAAIEEQLETDTAGANAERFLQGYEALLHATF